MAGKHAARTPAVRYLVPAAAAVVVGGSLVGLPIATGWLDRMSSGDAVVSEAEPSPSLAEPSSFPTDDPAAIPGPSLSLNPSPSPSASPKATRAPARAMQEATRSAKPSPSPSPRRSPTMAPAAASETCGVAYYETGEVTASGELFDPDDFTAAHPTLPFDTQVRVTNLANGLSVVVRINDRGPFIPGRCLDLSPAAFAEIAPLSSGVIQAKYEVLS